LLATRNGDVLVFYREKKRGNTVDARLLEIWKKKEGEMVSVTMTLILVEMMKRFKP